MCYSGDKGHFGECLTDKWNLVARKSNNNKKEEEEEEANIIL